MEKLSYKTFVWPQNPHTYKEDSSREGRYTKDDAGNDVFLGMGYLKSVITCTGAFFGANAVTEFQKLQKLFEEWQKKQQEGKGKEHDHSQQSSGGGGMGFGGMAGGLRNAAGTFK